MIPLKAPSIATPAPVLPVTGASAWRPALEPVSPTLPLPERRDRPAVEAAAQRLNEKAGAQAAEVQFRVDEDSGRLVVTVLDRRDGSVLRQIPSEEALELARRLDEAASALIDQRV